MNSRYSGAAWNNRFLPRLTTVDVAELPKEDALLVLPIGAVEQHGPHLPLFTDTLLVETVLEAACNHLPDTANVWLLPALPYGKSNEHSGRAGTVTISATTLSSLIMDIAASVKKSGFKRLLLFNGHGGNAALLGVTAREVRVEQEIMVFILHAGDLDVDRNLFSTQEQMLGIHAGDYETSLMMAACGEWVRSDRLVCEYPRLLETAKHLRFQRGNFAWKMDDLSASGVIGDATAASADKGTLIYEQHGKYLADVLVEMASFDMRQLRRD